MNRSHRKNHRANDTESRETQTISLINELISKHQDWLQIRKVAAVRGLVNNEVSTPTEMNLPPLATNPPQSYDHCPERLLTLLFLHPYTITLIPQVRSRVWPLLLNIKPADHTITSSYNHLHTLRHKDSPVVEADIARSLWSFTSGWTEEDRSQRRSALHRIIEAAIHGNTTGIHYYQGMHDIASVLLFICGEINAYKMLQVVVRNHLYDCTRPSLTAAVESLSLLYPILQVADPELHGYIHSLGEPSLEVPYFALSWYMTWYAHDVNNLADAARLFDLFLSSHPLMPLYVAAVAMRQNRHKLLEYSHDDGPMVYAVLKGLKVLGPADDGQQLTADELAQQAVALYQKIKPVDLLQKIPLEHSSAAFAYVENGRWVVPDDPSKSSLWKKRRRRGRGGGVVLAAVAGASGFVITVGAALLLSSSDQVWMHWAG